MAVAMTMAAMKMAVLRNSMNSQKAGLVVAGAVLGLILAGGTIAVAFVGDPNVGSVTGWHTGDMLAAAYAVWMLGWIFGPVFIGGGDETLRPEYFTLVGLRPRRLAFGLLTASFIGVAPVVSLVALAALVVFGVRLGSAASVLIALPAMLLSLVVFVLLSRVATAVMGLALRSRVGAIAAGLSNGVILAALGQGWVFFVAFQQVGGIPPTASAILRYLPSGWGLLAVEAAAEGAWPRSAAALGAMCLLIVLLLGAWAALLTRRTSAARPSVRGRRPMTAASAQGAVVAKEMRTWTRDLVRNHQLTFALAYAVFFTSCMLFMGMNGLLPYTGAVFILMAGAMSANLYGTDGTVLWLTLMTPGASEVRGRQWAWLLTVGPVGLALTVAGAAITGGPWPLPLALTAALLGGGAGIVPLISVYALVPGIDPHRRGGNPLRSSEDDGSLTGLAYAVIGLGGLTGVPAGLVASSYGWPGVAVGIATGALCVWGLGALAESRLRSHGPELLQTMRTGKRAQSASARWKKFDDLPKRDQIIAIVGWSFGAIPLFPQGIVAGVMKANGTREKSWFLALHVPDPWAWPVVVFMVLLGITLYGGALWVSYRPRPREEALPAAAA
ncbi:hypothetical protein Psi02_28590 [Planotetraspora silvatica]|uniref:ABC-2 type transport system permease protein n=1 Tax=Planotetraspora silvatica TaxID=234614 RepID=A0A8J3UL36_9ACTN|nr:hypothetical protein [Planotetraspora silvatica]GII46435.1 hypothetical protein Psi02_28590 [Planotetraspora silvatica]